MIPRRTKKRYLMLQFVLLKFLLLGIAINYPFPILNNRFHPFNHIGFQHQWSYQFLRNFIFIFVQKYSFTQDGSLYYYRFSIGPRCRYVLEEQFMNSLTSRFFKPFPMYSATIEIMEKLFFFRFDQNQMYLLNTSFSLFWQVKQTKRDCSFHLPLLYLLKISSCFLPIHSQLYWTDEY